MTKAFKASLWTQREFRRIPFARDSLILILSLKVLLASGIIGSENEARPWRQKLLLSFWVKSNTNWFFSFSSPETMFARVQLSRESFDPDLVFLLYNQGPILKNNLFRCSFSTSCQFKLFFISCTQKRATQKMSLPILFHQDSPRLKSQSSKNKESQIFHILNKRRCLWTVSGWL